jgi:hypothetical protein
MTNGKAPMTKANNIDPVESLNRLIVEPINGGTRFNDSTIQRFNDLIRHFSSTP